MTDRDAAYLRHILEATAHIEDFSRNITSASELHNHPLERAGIERMLTIIGEAAKNVSPDLRKKHPQIPWKETTGMRDKIMHHYFGVDYEAVYETVKHDLPVLKQEITVVLEEMEPVGSTGVTQKHPPGKETKGAR